MALEIARAVQTPFPPPDISSPRRSLAKRSFINSISETIRIQIKVQSSNTAKRIKRKIRGLSLWDQLINRTENLYLVSCLAGAEMEAKNGLILFLFGFFLTDRLNFNTRIPENLSHYNNIQQPKREQEVITAMNNRSKFSKEQISKMYQNTERISRCR